MEIATHLERVIARANAIQDLNLGASNFIGTEILNEAQKKMQLELSEEEYTTYIGYLEGNYDETKSFYELTLEEQKFYSYETAESYFVLYYLSNSLRQLVKGSGTVDDITFGGGKISSSDILKLIDSSNRFLDLALEFLGAGSSFSLVVV